jgi:hypothetical protein
VYRLVSFGSGRGPMAASSEQFNEPSYSIKSGEFIDQLRKRQFVSWSSVCLKLAIKIKKFNPILQSGVTHQTVNCLSTWSKTFHEKVIIIQLVIEWLALYKSRSFITIFENSWHKTLSWARGSQNFALYCCMTHFSMRPSHLRLLFPPFSSLHTLYNIICIIPPLFSDPNIQTGGTRWRSWLKHCATSRKVAG